MFTIAAVDPDAPDARMLLAELGTALAAITGSDGTASFDAADVRGPRSGFLVAYAADGSPAGCGALRPLEPLEGGVAELKRMYARPGSGAGTHLLAALERTAQAFGYRAVWLETRRVNARAVAFYARHGYAVIPNYGKYAGRLDAVCLGRELRGASC